MSQAQGNNTVFTLQLESAFGEDPSPDALLCYISGESLEAPQELIDSETFGHLAGLPARGNINANGSFNMELQVFMDHVWKWAMGAVSITEAAGVYTKVHTIGSTLTSAVIEAGYADITKYKKHNGCTPSGLTLTVPTFGHPTLTFPLLSKKETIGGSAFDSTPTNRTKILFDMANLSVLQVNGVDATIVTGFDLTVDHGLDGNSYPISISAFGQRNAIPRGRTTVKGNINCLFTDTTYYDLAVAGTEISLTSTFIKGTGAGTAGNEYFSLSVPEMQLGRASGKAESAAGVLVTFPFTGYYENDAGASPLIITTKNTIATV